MIDSREILHILDERRPAKPTLTSEFAGRVRATASQLPLDTTLSDVWCWTKTEPTRGIYDLWDAFVDQMSPAEHITFSKALGKLAFKEYDGHRLTLDDFQQYTPDNLLGFQNGRVTANFLYLSFHRVPPEDIPVAS